MQELCTASDNNQFMGIKLLYWEHMLQVYEISSTSVNQFSLNFLF